MPQVPHTRMAIFALLEEHGPLPSCTLAEHLQMPAETVRGSLRIAHKRGLIHISGWKRSMGTSGRWGPIYELGPGQDRKPPQVDSHKQANERYREKYREVLRRRMRARRGKPVDPWLAILGGL